MVDNAKAKALRQKRLEEMVSGRLTNPAAAIDALMQELAIGDPQPQIWERLHAAAANGLERELGAAYKQVISGRRFKSFTPAVRNAVLIHAGNYFMGILGDLATAEGYLMDALSLVPNQRELFERFERKFQSLPDKRQLLELYGTVAVDPPVKGLELAGKVVNLLVPLPAKTPLSDQACRGLVALVTASPNLLDVLEAHCRKTGRAKLASNIIEQALYIGNLTEAAGLQWRYKLIDLMVGEAETPERAIEHIEFVLRRDQNDPHVRSAVSKLVGMRALSDQVSAMIQSVRHNARPG